jgi:CDP-L-myo-inositol myo-inositolphosphotransferase
MTWALVLEPSNGDANRRVAGLSLALRLALDAQRCGATAVVRCAAIARESLMDERLRISVKDAVDRDVENIRVPACVVMHRDAFKLAGAGAGHAPSLDDLAHASVAAPFGFTPIEVVDRESAQRAERALFRALRKREDGWTARWLNRPVSLTISRWLVKTPLRPNQISIGILFVGLSGAYLASKGAYASAFAGALLFHAQSVLDGCDGEMSRVTYRASLLGEWLDTIGDDVTNYAFFGCAAWGLYGHTGNKIYAIAGMVTVGAGIVASAIEYRYLAKIGSGDLLKYPITRQSEKPSGITAAISPLFKRDTFVFLTLVAAAFDALGPMLVLFAAGALIILGNVFAAELRMVRERNARPRNGE